MSSVLSSNRSSPVPELGFDSYRGGMSLREQTLVNRQLRSGHPASVGPTTRNGSNNLDTLNAPPDRPRLPNPNIQQTLNPKDYVTIRGDTYALGPYTTEALFLWVLLAILSVLVIANSTLTFIIFGSLRLGSGMESIEFLPTLLKFYGDIDLDDVTKLDGIIQSFGNEPLEINAVEGGKVQFKVHEGTKPSISLDKTGINLTHVEEFSVISQSGERVFSTTSPILDLPSGIKDFRVRMAKVNRITSGLNSSLDISSSSVTYLKGSEGTTIDGKTILLSADRDILLKANGDMILSGRNGLSLYTQSLPLVEAFGVTWNHYKTPTQGKKQAQFKLCICMPQGKLFRIQIPVNNSKNQTKRLEFILVRHGPPLMSYKFNRTCAALRVYKRDSWYITLYCCDNNGIGKNRAKGFHLMLDKPVGLKKKPPGLNALEQIYSFRSPILVCSLAFQTQNSFHLKLVPNPVETMEVVECVENCWILSPPSLPPPPPIPQFLSYLNLTIDCDLCTWAGVKVGSVDPQDATAIPLSSLLIVVGVISACCGAGIMAAILSIKRIRSFNNATGIRHLARKESNAARSTTAEGFPSSAFSENTYCDAPYPTSDKDSSTNCNIYAELHEPRAERVWTRPPVSPPIENCYLELTDASVRLGPKIVRPWFQEESPNSSSYYSDLELMKMSNPTTGSNFHRA